MTSMHLRMVRATFVLVAATSFCLAAVGCASAGPDDPAPTTEGTQGVADPQAPQTSHETSPETFPLPHVPPALCTPTPTGWRCVDGGVGGIPRNY